MVIGQLCLLRNDVRGLGVIRSRHARPFYDLLQASVNPFYKDAASSFDRSHLHPPRRLSC